MNAAVSVRQLVRLLGLRDAALDGEVDQFLVALAPGATVIDLFLTVAVLVVAIGIDRAERACTACLRPMPGRYARRHGNALAAFNKRQNVDASHTDRVNRFHDWVSSPG